MATESKSNDKENKIPLLKCDKCHEEYESREGLTNHMQTHLGQSFQCEQCSQTFTNKAYLKNHKQRVHEVRPLLQCEICSKGLKSKQGLKLHMANHSTSDLPFQCEQCPKMFAAKWILANHVKNVHPAGVLFQCEVCPKAYKTKPGLQGHRLTHSTDNIRCELCDRMFKTMVGLRVHQKKYHSSHTFKCEHCEDEFPTRKRYDDHVYNIHTKPAYTCGLCELSFKAVTLLNRHREQNHETTEKCEQCDHAFYLKDDLSVHIKNVHTKTVIQCELCPKIYKSRQGMLEHLRSVHTKEAPFACPICDKHFNLVCSLRTHKLSHEREKFKCEQCTREFTKKALWISHTRNHHKLIECEICQQCYENKYYVTHLRIHTGEKPLICKECGSCFSTWNILQNHQKIH